VKRRSEHRRARCGRSERCHGVGCPPCGTHKTHGKSPTCTVQCSSASSGRGGIQRVHRDDTSKSGAEHSLGQHTRSSSRSHLTEHTQQHSSLRSPSSSEGAVHDMMVNTVCVNTLSGSGRRQAGNENVKLGQCVVSPHFLR
jgi:hypothetical protein